MADDNDDDRELDYWGGGGGDGDGDDVRPAELWIRGQRGRWGEEGKGKGAMRFTDLVQ